jgi:tetratricopeptide (TPR) repeat protein
MRTTSDPQEDQRKQALDYFQKAYKYQMNGKLEAAIDHYKKSISTYPTAEAYTFLGWTYSFMGRYDEAIAECHKAIEVDPDFGNPYNDIGAYYIELGQPDEAIPWLEKAIHAPRYESYCYPHLNLGRIWEKKGLWDKAIDNYQRSLNANPNYVLAARALNRLRGMLN